MSTPVVALVAEPQCSTLRQLLRIESTKVNVPTVAEVECAMLRQLINQKRLLLAVEKANTERKKEDLEQEIASVEEKSAELRNIQTASEEQKTQFENLIKWRSDVLLEHTSKMTKERTLTGYVVEDYKWLEAKEKAIEERGVKLNEELEKLNEKFKSLTDETKRNAALKERRN